MLALMLSNLLGGPGKWTLVSPQLDVNDMIVSGSTFVVLAGHEIYVSGDGGENWGTIVEGLPRTEGGALKGFPYRIDAASGILLGLFPQPGEMDLSGMGIYRLEGARPIRKLG